MNGERDYVWPGDMHALHHRCRISDRGVVLIARVLAWREDQRRERERRRHVWMHNFLEAVRGLLKVRRSA